MPRACKEGVGTACWYTGQCGAKGSMEFTAVRQRFRSMAACRGHAKRVQAQPAGIQGNAALRDPWNLQRQGSVLGVWPHAEGMQKGCRFSLQKR